MAGERGGGYLTRPAPSGLADVVETILNKGIVIDAYARVSLLGIELVTLDARIVVASVDTYLRFAEATNRLDLSEQGGLGLPEIATEGVGTVEKKVDDVVDSVEDKTGLPVRRAAQKVGDVVEAVVDKVEDASNGKSRDE